MRLVRRPRLDGRGRPICGPITPMRKTRERTRKKTRELDSRVISQIRPRHPAVRAKCEPAGILDHAPPTSWTIVVKYPGIDADQITGYLKAGRGRLTRRYATPHGRQRLRLPGWAAALSCVSLGPAADGAVPTRGAASGAPQLRRRQRQGQASTTDKGRRAAGPQRAWRS